MPGSKREAVLADVASTLTTVPGSSGSYRSLQQALDESEGTSIVYGWSEDALEMPQADGPVDRFLLLTVSVLARESGSDTADKVADPVMVEAYALLMADPTLGGTAIDIAPQGGRFQNVDGNNNPGVLSQDFRIHYRHDYGAMNT